MDDGTNSPRSNRPVWRLWPFVSCMYQMVPRSGTHMLVDSNIELEMWILGHINRDSRPPICCVLW